MAATRVYGVTGALRLSRRRTLPASPWAEARRRAEAWAAADRFARRKRVGPYATAPLDPKQREKAIAAFLRAGHDYAVARRWVDAAPGEALAQEEE